MAVTVPLGGGSSNTSTPGAPYYEFQKQTGKDPLNVPTEYLSWLQANYPQVWKTWYDQFTQYRRYLNRGSAPSGAISFGVGGGYGGYGYGRRGWW